MSRRRRRPVGRAAPVVTGVRAMQIGRPASRGHRPVLCTLILAVALTSGAAAFAAAANGPVDVGGQKQLFIDDRFIAKSSQVKRVANSAQKLGRIKDENG